jgi:Raf kinase inhibitor-like YbhB/YbcL family protein
MMLSLSSDVFDTGGEIPSRHTCDGKNVSPSLSWSGAPDGTQSFALIVDDPDAPKTTWVHWVLYNLPATSTGLSEAIAADLLPSGTLHGSNDWQCTGYGGPCPPIGRHRYFFKLYALDIELPNLRLPGKNALERAMQSHVLENAVLMGTYRRAPGSS